MKKPSKPSSVPHFATYIIIGVGSSLLVFIAFMLHGFYPFIVIALMFILFFLLRIIHKALRRPIDEVSYRLVGHRGFFVWFWISAPGTIFRHLSQTFAVLLFRPFGFYLTKIELFHVKSKIKVGVGERQSLQTGEVQYVRPQGSFISYIGDGFCVIAPLLCGIVVFSFLYRFATGYNIWNSTPFLQPLRPGWPWWALVPTACLNLMFTSQLKLSLSDLRMVRWLILGLFILTPITIITLWLTKTLIFNNDLFLPLLLIAAHIDFVLLVLIAVDVFFLIIWSGLDWILRRK